MNQSLPWNLVLAWQVLLVSVRLLTLLDFAELYVGLGGEPQVLPTSLLSEKSDVISFLKHYVHDKLMAQDKKVSYFSIRVAIGSSAQPVATQRAFQYSCDFQHFEAPNQ